MNTFEIEVLRNSSRDTYRATRFSEIWNGDQEMLKFQDHPFQSDLRLLIELLVID